MYLKGDQGGHPRPFPGVRVKTPCYGALSLMAEFRMAASSTVPRHAHTHEQIGYLVSGHLRLTVGDRAHDVRPGDSWCVPLDVEHGPTALEDSVAVEVFAPVREDYLPAHPNAVGAVSRGGMAEQ